MYGDALTTKARVKDRLQITVTSFDTLLDNLILAITKRISVMCHRRFLQATFTHELHDGSDVLGSARSVLIIKNSPVGTVSAVQYDAGTNSTPNWTDFDENDYRLDAEAGLLYFSGGLPGGKQNIRLTYTGGYSGYSIGIENYWVYGIVPTGALGQLTFTLPEDAAEILVYADGLRVLASNYTFVAGTDSFVLDAGQEPYSSISVDYRASIASADSEQWLPADLVDVAERAVIHLFKKRDSEGRSSESFAESSITWNESTFSDEDRATIKNYRRGNSL